jgi:hypothetical protein
VAIVRRAPGGLLRLGKAPSSRPAVALNSDRLPDALALSHFRPADEFELAAANVGPRQQRGDFQHTANLVLDSVILMSTTTITLGLPPSINHLWRTGRGGRRARNATPRWQVMAVTACWDTAIAPGLAIISVKSTFVAAEV